MTFFVCARGCRWQTRLFALQCLQGLVTAVDEGVSLSLRDSATDAGQGSRTKNAAAETAAFPRAHLDLALARAAPGGEGAYLVGRLNALVATAYLAVSSMNLVLRVQGAALLEAVVRALAQSRDPDAADEDDERAGAAPSLLDQCQAQIASILRLAFDPANRAPALTICACNVCFELVGRGVRLCVPVCEYVYVFVFMHV